jgi:hypothetical protein
MHLVIGHDRGNVLERIVSGTGEDAGMHAIADANVGQRWEAGSCFGHAASMPGAAEPGIRAQHRCRDGKLRTGLRNAAGCVGSH